MPRNDMIEKLNETIRGMDDISIKFLADRADTLVNGTSLAEVRKKIEAGERAAAEQRRAAREQRLANLTRCEKVVFNRIQKGKALVREDPERRDLTMWATFYGTYLRRAHNLRAMLFTSVFQKGIRPGINNKIIKSGRPELLPAFDYHALRPRYRPAFHLKIFL